MSPLPCYLLKTSAVAPAPVHTLCWAIRLPEPSAADPGAGRRQQPEGALLSDLDLLEDWTGQAVAPVTLYTLTAPPDHLPRLPVHSGLRASFTAWTEPRPLPVEAGSEIWAAPGRGHRSLQKTIPVRFVHLFPPSASALPPPSGWHLSGGLLGNARAAALSTQGTVLRVSPLQVRTGGGRLCARTKSVGLPSTCARPLPLHRIWPPFPLKQGNAGRKMENPSDNSHTKEKGRKSRPQD